MVLAGTAIASLRTGSLWSGSVWRLNRLAGPSVFAYALKMASSIFRTEKRLRGRPRTDATSIHLTLTPEPLAALDAYVAAQPEPRPSRPEAIRFLLRDSLTGLGYLPPRDAPEMAN